MSVPLDRAPLIRLAVSADAGPLSALILRTIRTTNAQDYPAEEIERVCASFTPDAVTEKMAERDVFLCLADEAPVGTVSLGPATRPPGSTVKLHALFVAPEWQGLGLGARLVAHLEAHARDGGHRLLQVSSSITAKAFYGGLGYRALAFEPRPEGATYLMEKPLV